MHFLINLMIFVLLFSAPVLAQEASYSVSYNKQKDTLSLKVEQGSLKQVLARIAMQSHIEVLFDERADQTISMALDDRPLQDGLKNLLNGSSHAFRYTRDKNDKLMLIGVSVLPKGDGPDGNAQPLLNAMGEGFMNAKHNQAPSIEESERRSLANQRWQARLAEMPKVTREKIEQNVKARLEKQAKKRADKKARSDAKKAKREARKAEKLAKRQKELEELSPEDRALKEQRRENARIRSLNAKWD